MSGPLDLPGRVAGEVASAVPLLVERTRSQIELAQRILVQLPCSPFHRGSSRSGHEAAGAAAPETTPSEPSDDGVPAAPASAVDAVDEGAPAAPEPEVPAVSAPDLAIPDYDSLAASQVVPRLASLSAAELALVLTYEQSHRSRQTILNRVRQLQAAANGS